MTNTTNFATDAVADIETMDTEPTAVITSIGVHAWNYKTGKAVAEFHERIDWKDAMARYPFTKSSSTEDFWAKQSIEARMELKGTRKIEDVLDSFSDWWSSNCKKSTIIGNGANFDPVILENAFKVTGKKIPWSYYKIEDLRTMVTIGRRYLNIDPKKEIEFAGVKHHSLYDARHEAEIAKEIQKALQKTEVVAA